LRGDALLSAYYVNELVMHFLHRDDPQPEIFALYAEAIAQLGTGDDVAAALRNFELDILSLLGYEVSVEHVAGTREDVDPEGNYDYRVEQGPVPVRREEGPLVFRGAILQSIGARQFDDADVLRAASRLLRHVIAHHLGGKELQSRKVLLEVHRGRIAPPNGRTPAHD
jgi:DNA repair protein RecO (recombination protein O)